MRHIELSAFASDIRPLLATVAMLLASVLAPMSAQAVPYNLCVSLADSSGQAAGTHTFRCDPTSLNETLVSTTFGDPVTLGGYEGTARASSDSFDTVRLFASALLTNYLPGSYVPYDVGGGIQGTDFAATASANYTDLVSISGPAPQAVLQLSFGVTGTLTQAGASAQLCYGFAFGGPILGGVCLVGLPPVITVESAPFAPDGNARELNFQFMAVVFNTDESQTNPYSASATTDLEHTIHLQELLVTTLGDEPIQGITLTSAGGFDYPLSALNQATTVAEPETYGLVLAGLGLLGFVARRRKQKAA